MSQVPSIEREPLRSVLEGLHAEARRDRYRFVGMVPRLAAGLIRRQPLWDTLTPEFMKECFIPVSPEQGRFLYLTARAIAATRIVEFGTSFGISTLYLAAAVKDNGGGIVIGSEIEPGKRARAQQHLREGEVAEYAEIRLGDALETLREVPEPVDLVLMDGWKDLYMPILQLLIPRLRPGSVVLSDNIFTFRKSLRPYVEFLQNPANGFASTTLHISDGFEYSVYQGKPA